MGVGCIVAAISGIGEDAGELVSDCPFRVGNDGRERVAVIGIAGQGFRMERARIEQGIGVVKRFKRVALRR